MIRKYILFLLLVCIHGLARGQTAEYTGFYWFDDEQGMPIVSPTVQGSFDVDASSLADGLHAFHYVVAKKDGGISQPSTNYFVKMSSTSTSLKGFYWFDNEPTAYEATTLNGMFEVDASTLSDGFHQFSYIATQDNGGLAKPASCYFLKTAQVSEEDSLTCICSVDGQLRHIEKLSQQGGIIHWSLDMLDLADGIHQIQLQAVTKSGALSSSYSSYFMRVTSNEELNEMRCIYAIDNESFHANSNIVSSNGNYHFDLDLSELSDGLHYVSFLLHNDRGTISKVQTRFFLKVPLGGNGINQYQYWLNEDDVEQARTITLPEKVNPLQLMSLLPVESRPFRSSLFHFDVSSGTPMVYAKNTIHLRFYDVSMRFTDVAKDYADYNVSQEVNVIKTLESGVSETTAWPEENEIKWYQVTAERGDSLRFKLDHAATLQLFAPSGKEVYNVSGAESVFGGGLHAAESGTFYVALHDVTAMQGDDIRIDYEHIDKYAVLRQDVTVVGNGGCSTITFEGNGFKDLYAVDLYNEQGDTIKHIHIGHESDATTSVTFDFTGVELGEYYVMFHFAESNLVLAKHIIVEEPVDIELATTVVFPSGFWRGFSTTYTIKIANTGNMTAYNVPINIKIICPSTNGITHVSVDGLGLKKLFDSVDNFEGWTNDEVESYKQLCDALGDDHYFIKTKSTDGKGDSILVRTGLFEVNVAQNTTKEISFTLTSLDAVQVWVAVAEEVFPLTSNTHAQQLPKKAPSVSDVKSWFCCHYDQITCYGNIVTTGLDAASIASIFGGPEAPAIIGAISCAINKINAALNASAVVCNENIGEMTLWEIIKTIFNESKASFFSTVISCLANKVSSATNLYKILNSGSFISDITLGGVDCYDYFTDENPCCTSTCGPPPGGVSRPSFSGDPNDILGYIAESGNQAIKDGQNEVYYNIEFENDPEIANGAAHDIYVTDTLDATKFDLSTFTPTRVRIGEKSTELTGEKNFVTTIDMRPEINAIAQVEGTFDEQTGIARWHISSLDPMTMEPTQYVMDGVLPVNTDGRGIGEVMYDIQLKPGLAHGTEVNNRAGIVFDNNDVIMTPTWTNVIDRIAPVSHITSVEQVEDSETGTVTIEATDELSGPWHYDVYVQYGCGTWFKAAENVAVGTTATVKLYEGVEHHFYCVATDMAGNVEQKEPESEASLSVGEVTRKGDVNGDGEINAQDASLILQYVARKFGDNQEGFKKKAADANGDGEQSAQDASLILQHAAKKIDLTK